MTSCSPEHEARIRKISNGLCELCRECGDPDSLQVHLIPGITHPDPHRRMLLLCPLCHAHVHLLAVGPEKQAAWTEGRPYALRKAIRRICGYSPEPYVPPACEDLAELYQIACAGWCLNGSG